MRKASICAGIWRDVRGLLDVLNARWLRCPSSSKDSVGKLLHVESKDVRAIAMHCSLNLRIGISSVPEYLVDLPEKIMVLRGGY